MDKLELKSRHQVIYTVDVADVESIFYCKPTDPDILTVLMADGKRLYCDEVCPLQEEPVSNDLEEAARKAGQKYFPDESNIWARPNYEAKAAEYAFKEGAQWQKEQMIDKACEWLKSYRQDTPDGTGYIAGIIDDKTIKEFKQAMEEKL